MSTSVAKPSVSALESVPLDVTTSNQAVHTAALGEVVVITLNNRTAAVVEVTPTLGGVEFGPFEVPAKGLETVGPFSIAGAILLRATSADAVRAILYITRNA